MPPMPSTATSRASLAISSRGFADGEPPRYRETIEREWSFVPQRFDRVEVRRPPRGPDRSDQRDHDQQCGYRHERDGVIGPRLDQHPLNGAADAKRCAEPCGDTHPQRRHRAPDEQPDHLRWPRAEGNADAYLARP